MKKKTLSLILAAAVVASLSACGSSSSQTAESAATAETESSEIDFNAVLEQSQAQSEQTVEGGDEDGNDALVEYESPLGYSVQYNQDMFTLETTEDSDTFTYSGDDLEAPVYVAIQRFTDMDAEAVANGVALQSGQDDVTVNEGTFGDENEGFMVSYSEEAEGINRFYSYFAVPQGDGCLLMESGTYEGVPGYEIDGNIELIIDSFKPAQ